MSMPASTSNGPGSWIPVAVSMLIAEMVTMREGGSSLMAIRNAIRRQGHRISQETVRRVCERHAATAEAAE